MPTCKEPDCLDDVRLVPDKDQEPVTWRGDNDSLIVLYSSKVCDSGLCSYHWRKRYYAKVWEGVVRDRALTRWEGR